MGHGRHRKQTNTARVVARVMVAGIPVAVVATGASAPADASTMPAPEQLQPVLHTEVAPIVAAVADSTPTEVIQIVSGDTLAKLAAARGADWHQIYADNAGVIGADPNRIFPGQRLTVGRHADLTEDGAVVPQAEKPAVPASGSVAAVIASAQAEVGDPYIWGGNGPNGWDCSGLVQHAFAAAGVKLPRTSAAQAAVGTPVSKANLQPGDVVYFGSPVHHIAIYVGDGQIIQAPRPGLKVQRVPLAQGGGDYAGARRILNG